MCGAFVVSIAVLLAAGSPAATRVDDDSQQAGEEGNMHRQEQHTTIIAKLDLAGISEGEVLHPRESVPEDERALHESWERPLSPWGVHSVGAGMACVAEGGQPVLAFTGGSGWDRAIVARGLDMRDGTIVAEVMPVEQDATPSADIPDVSEAIAGVVFRVKTSREYYHFGIEGNRRLVLYRRTDDEWFVLAEQAIEPLSDYATLVVRLNGDGIRCESPELGVLFRITDTAFLSGKVGLRVMNKANVRCFEISQTDAQRERDVRRREREEAEIARLGADIPDAKIVRTYNLADLGGNPTFRDFAEPGRYDMLVEGRKLRALTSEGELMWEIPERIRRCFFSREFESSGRLIYGLAGSREVRPGHSVQDELVVIAGRTGTVLARRKLPETEPDLTMWDLSPTSAALSSGDATDIVLRDWRGNYENGGLNLWAYDRDLNLLWHRVQDGAGAHFGHTWAVAFHDIDRDGRDEMLAGGVMYDSDGTVLWTHDGTDEMLSTKGAKHYDAVVLGDLAGNDEDDPTALLISGSAGVHVVDALTGETRAVHRMGHAQGYSIGKVRPDLPGMDVLVSTRWGNFGIQTLFSGRGERLWTIQPDYNGLGSTPVEWGSARHRLIWTNTSARAQAFYDGYGRLVKRLPELSRAWGDGMDNVQRGYAVRMGYDEGNFLTLARNGVLYVFGPDE